MEDKKQGKKIVVTGCLVERYYEDLKRDLPEVDLFIRIKDYKNFGQLVSSLFATSLTEGLDFNNRVLTTQKHFAYVKISEGCDNRCHYCAIPLIRGNFRSRKLESIVSEVKNLVSHGVKEIVLISQDTTRYGQDLPENTNLMTLLKKILKIDGLLYVRFLYLYLEEMPYDLIDFIAANPKICRYFDIPIQHASDKILKNMNRRDTKAEIRSKIEYIRLLMPKAIIRSTVIVGYPTENEIDYQELVAFIKEIHFDKLGVFTYSREEDTKAYDMPEQVDEATKQSRHDYLISIQEEISLKQNQKHVDEIQVAIIEEKVETNLYLARSYAFAPDDIDGYLFVSSKENLSIGQVCEVVITSCDNYNLYSRLR